jgi:prohibitin 1
MVFIVASIVGLIAAIAISKARTSANRGVATIVLVAAIALAFFQCVSIVPAGHVGVVDLFGRVSERTLRSGLQVRNPFASVIMMTVKTQEFKEAMPVPSKEGMTVGLEVSCLYHLNPDKAAIVYRDVGVNFEEVILIPQFRSVARGVTASYEAKSLYTSEREALSLALKEGLEAQLAPRGITIESTPLRSVTLPQGLAQAIEEKLKMEQESQRMQFVLLKEAQEAERKRVEAQGIADFQRIVTQGISEPLLRWKGIEATEKLAASSNAKFVIIGGKDGLPVILNPDK